MFIRAFWFIQKVIKSMKPIKVSITKYESKDGKVFDTEEAALIQDDIVDGKKRVCPGCKGEKKVWNDDGRGQYSCGACNGKGYQELKWA